jgi:hypothetical protein
VVRKKYQLRQGKINKMKVRTNMVERRASNAKGQFGYPNDRRKQYSENMVVIVLASPQAGTAALESVLHSPVDNPRWGAEFATDASIAVLSKTAAA